MRGDRLAAALASFADDEPDALAVGDVEDDAARGADGRLYDSPSLGVILDLHERGVLMSRIAARVGLSARHVRRLLRCRGLQPNLESRAKAPPLVVRLHRDGLRPDEIACEIGVSARHVRRVLKANHLRPRRKKRQASSVRPSVLAFHAEGFETPKIASLLGVTRNHVTRLLTEAGLKPHPSAQTRLMQVGVGDVLRGMTVAEAARRRGLNAGSLSDAVRRFRRGGVPTPQESED